MRLVNFRLCWLIFYVMFLGCTSQQDVQVSAPPKQGSTGGQNTTNKRSETNNTGNGQGQIQTDPHNLQSNGNGQPSTVTGSINIEVPSEQQLSVRELNTLLSSWAQKAPTLLTYSKYADVNGQDASFLRITANPNQTLPKVMITGATHGNEQITTTVLISVFYQLISQYGKNNSVTDLLNSRDIYFVPVVCPDAYENDTREADGQDPNRSFPYPNNPQGNPSKCISEIMKLFNEKQFNATLDYHAQAGMIMYPWAYTSSEVSSQEHGNEYKIISQKMADLAQYQWGQIINLVGESPGSSADYYHWQGNKMGLHTFSLGVEVIGETKTDIDAGLKILPVFIKEAPIASQNGAGNWSMGNNVPEPPPFVPPPGFVWGME